MNRRVVIVTAVAGICGAIAVTTTHTQNSPKMAHRSVFLRDKPIVRGRLSETHPHGFFSETITDSTQVSERIILENLPKSTRARIQSVDFDKQYLACFITSHLLVEPGRTRGDSPRSYYSDNTHYFEVTDSEIVERHTERFTTVLEIWSSEHHPQSSITKLK